MCPISWYAPQIFMLSYNTRVSGQGNRAGNTCNPLFCIRNSGATFGIQKVADRVAPGTFQLLQTGPPYNQFTQQ